MPNFLAKYQYLQERLRIIEGLPAFTAEVVRKHADVLLQLNKDGILLGRNTEGKEFTPGYLADPYFKTPEQAGAYYDRKQALWPAHRTRISFPLNYPEKSPDTPNLIVRGNFQNAMFITFTADGFDIRSRYKDTPLIVQKYENKVFGLTPEAIRYFWENYLRPELVEYLNRTR
jgi:hypothetical protein